MAFGETWLISIMLRMTSNAARGFMETGNAATLAAVKVDAATKAIGRFEASTVSAGTRIAGMFALVGGAITVYGVKRAADFQLAMTNVFAATGANIRQQNSLSSMAMYWSGQTAQSSLTMAQEMATAATSGLNDPGRLSSAFPQLAKAADVLMLSPKHIDPIEAVKRLTQLSHLFGAYSGQPLHDMVDRAVRLLYTQPEGITPAVTQGRMFIGLANRFGVSMKEQFDMLGIMGQTGYLRSRGGSGLANYMLYLMGATNITSHMSKARRAALVDMGVFDSSGRNRFLDSKGNLMLEKSLAYFNQLGDKWTKEGRQSEFVTDLVNAFLKQGGAFASVITQDRVYAQIAKNRTATNRIAPEGQAVEVLWKMYTHTFIFQFRYFLTNLQNVFQSIFLPLLPSLTDLFHGLGSALGALSGFLQDNPGIAGTLGAIIMAFTGLSGLRFALVPLMGLFAGAAEFAASAGEIGTAATALRFLDNLFLAGLGNRVWGVVRAIAGLKVAETAAGDVTTLGTAIKGLAGAGAAFMASPLGKLFSLGGVLFGTTSFLPRDQGFQDTINRAYGPAYGAYLKRHGIGVDNFNVHGGKGYLGPQDFMKKEAPGGGFGVHQTFNINLPHGTTEQHAKKVAELSMKGLKSAIQSRGDTSFTNPFTAPVLGMEGAAMTHGLG